MHGLSMTIVPNKLNNGLNRGCHSVQCKVVSAKIDWVTNEKVACHKDFMGRQGY